MCDDNRKIEIGDKLAMHFETLTEADLATASGLGLPQPEQYKIQQETMQSWGRFATRGYNKDQRIAYANVPLLAVAETTRRAGNIPTVCETIVEVIQRGFMPKRAGWFGKKLHSELAGYLRSAEKRGLCRLG